MSSTPHTTGAAKVFYSYAHEDESLRNELEKHLRGLKLAGQITEWHDRQIEAGKKWAGEINAHLESADIILLLISHHFIASEYCYGVELQRALKRHEAGEARVIPIILRDVDWTELEFSELQALPTDGKAVTSSSWKNRDEAFADVARGIRRTVENILPHLRSGSRPLDRTRSDQPEIQEILPYLCDRSDQEVELEKALEYRTENFERRPFVCIIHGDEYECLDMFETRLKQFSLPRLLNPGAGPIEMEITLQWPPSGVKVLAEALKFFQKDLAEALEINRGADPKEIVNRLSLLTGPILVWLHLDVESWSGAGSELRDSFIKFWNDFPDLPLERPVIACLFLKYKSADKMGVFAKWRYGRLCNETRKFLAGLNFTAYGNLHGTVLPELRGIGEQEAESWILDSKNFREICKVHGGLCDRHALLEAISSLYDAEYRGFRGRVPIKFLAKDLKSLLEKQRCRS